MSDERPRDGKRMDAGEVEAPGDRALAALLRTHASRPRAPAALRARIEAALEAEIARIAYRPRPSARWTTVGPALAAAVAGLLLAAVTGAAWRALPATSQRLALYAVREARAEYARLEQVGPSFTADDPAVLSQALTDALGVTVRIGKPPGGAPRLVGTGPSTLFGARGAAVFYEAEGELLTLSFVPSRAGLPQEGRVRLGRGRPFVASASGTRFVLWRQGPLFCALAGDFPEARLTTIFRKIRPGIEVGS